MRTPPLTSLAWPASLRIIPSRFPPIDLFERVTDPADLAAVIEVESLTNDRLRDQVGELERVAREERVAGTGAPYVMASFTHLPAPGAGGRFNDSTFGAYYAAGDLETAIDETVFHRERFLRDARAVAQVVDMRVLSATIEAEIHDLRGWEAPDVYDPDEYSAGQRLAAALRSAGSWGVAYRSVRRPGGECVAVFRPRAIRRCRQTAHLAYHWDGVRIRHVVRMKLMPRPAD